MLFGSRHLSPKRGRNKFTASPQRSWFGAAHSPSGREADEASHIELMRKAGEIKSWDRQVKLDLTVNGVHIGNYYVDFMIEHNDGTVEYREVKGAETPTWIMKWRLAKALYERHGGTFRVVK